MNPTITNFTPFKKERSEEYSTQVKIHHKLVESVTPLVLNLLEKSVPIQGQPFAIGDYGSADGGTSYTLFQRAVALLREKHDASLPIQLVYVDEPINDFKPAFMRAQGLVEGTSGLAVEFSNLYVLAAGCSFYSQCVPRESLDFIVCFLSAHWLSKCPGIPCSSLFPSNTEGDAYTAFKVQAAVDWETFLLMRAKELKPGGNLVVTSLWCTPDDRVKFSVMDFHDRISRVWRQLFDEGIISKVEFDCTEIGIHYRSREELEKPFKDAESAVLKSGLILVSIETNIVPCPFRDQWAKLTKNHENVPSAARDHATAVVAAARAWIEGSLHQGLGKHRSEEDITKVLDIFFELFREKVARDPLPHSPDIVQNCLIIRKQSVEESF